MSQVNLTRTDKGAYTCPDDPGEPTTNLPRVSIADDEVHLLAWLVRGKSVLEIGTGLGVSAQAMKRTARNVLTVDPDKWVKENVAPMLVAQGIRFRTGTDALGKFDVVFIDGDHTAEQVQKDIAEAIKHLDNGGLIILHDTKLESVARAIEGLNVVRIDTTHGIGLLWQ